MEACCAGEGLNAAGLRFGVYVRVLIPGFLVMSSDFALCGRTYPVDRWWLPNEFGHAPKILRKAR